MNRDFKWNKLVVGVEGPSHPTQQLNLGEVRSLLAA